jgi:hypothetical protein
MDDPIVEPSATMKLRRSCERNRLEQQLLSRAYESLIAIIKNDRRQGTEDEGFATPDYPAAERNAVPSEASEALAKAG